MRILAPLLALSLIGCAPASETYHWKTGASLALLGDELASCRFAAAREVPADTRIGQTPIMQTPIQTICRPGNAPGETACTTIGGQIHGGQVYSYDANESLRRDYLKRCMARQGYSVATVPACAQNVIPADVNSLVGKGSRPPVEGACAVRLSTGGHVLLYPGETAN